MGAERRQAKRVSFMCEVECDGSEGQAVANTRLSDLSVSGAFVESVIELPVGTQLTLKFPIGSTTLEVAAEVVHYMPQFGMGVRFKNLTSEQRALIERTVNENS